MITVWPAHLDQWQGHIDPSINKVPAVQYKPYNAADGSLVVLNDSNQEFGGGLVSPISDYPIPANAQFFGLDVDWVETAEDLPHKPRNENDLKCTFGGGLQANGSSEWNKTAGAWQLDPDGKGWVSTGYTKAPQVGWNRYQLRIWSDGLTKWSVTGLRLIHADDFVYNQGFESAPPYVPPAQFQNLPMINTGANGHPWGPGLHAQLQVECSGTPWFLRCIYSRVLIAASSAVIPWNI